MGFSLRAEAAKDASEVSGEIDVIFNQSQSTMKPYIEAFEKKYPNCKVNYTPLYDYDQDIGGLIESGEYGDVCFVPSYFTIDDVKSAFLPLDTFSNLEEKYNFLDKAFAQSGILYSIPSSAYLFGIVYNETVFNQAGIGENPKSPDEFLEDLRLIQERTDVIPMYSGYGLDWLFYNWTNFPYLEMTGDVSYRSQFVHELDPFTEGGTYYTVYKLLYDCIANGYTEQKGSMNSDWYTVCSKVHTGNIACMVVGSWAMNQIKNSGTSEDTISFMPFPNEVDGKQYVTIMTDYGYGIPSNSDNPVAARAFIDFMLDESGYAVETDRVSIVKTDPLPQSYGNMDNNVISTNGDYLGNDYELYSQLITGVNPTANENVKRIVQSGYGINEESFDDIMSEWNEAWESARPEDMETYSRDSSEKEQTSYTQESSSYVSLDPIEYEISFSSTEKEYIEEHPVLMVGCLADFAPYTYEKEDELCGVSMDLMDEFAKQTGIEIQYATYKNTQDMVAALNRGEIDMIASYFVIGYHQKNLKISISYFETNNVLLRNDSASVDDSVNNVQAILAGENNQLDLVNTRKYKSVFSYEELLDSIEDGNADYAYTNYYTGQYYLRKQSCEHVEIVPAGDKVDLVFAFSADVDTRLVSISNKFIYGLSDTYMQFSMMNHMNPPVSEVTWKRIVQTYSVQIIVIIVLIFMGIIVGIVLFMSERNKGKAHRLIDAKKYEILSRMMDEFIFEYHIKEKRLELDQKFEDKFAYGRTIVGERARLSKEQALLLKLCEDAVPFDKMTSNPIELEDKEGVKEWFRVISYQISDDKKDTKELIGKIVNVNYSVLENLKIKDEAVKDSLTGIYNRKGFEMNCIERMENRRDLESVCLAIIDLDDFKTVNDSIGHSGGDEALRMLGGFLKQMSSDSIITGRYGGDEFMLVAFGVSEQEMTKILQKLVTSMDTEMLYNDNSCKLSVSVGAYFFTSNYDAKTVFEKADHTLYKVKKNGKNNFQIQVEH